MPKTANSATALLSRLASGNRVAQEEVCRRYGKRVYWIVRRRLGRKLRARVETADVVQEAMVDILQDACGCRFASEKDFLNWVRAIVEHRIQEIAGYWGAAKRRRSREVRLPTKEVRADHRAERPSQIFRRKEDHQRLCVTMTRLPAADRQILVSRLFLGLSWDHVASSLGTTEAAAQMRFVRARRRLAQELSSSD